MYRNFVGFTLPEVSASFSYRIGTYVFEWPFILACVYSVTVLLPLLCTYLHMHLIQSWAHRSLKLLNRSSLLSELSFWERWRSIRKRANSNERTDIIQIMSGSLMSDIRTKERSKNG